MKIMGYGVAVFIFGAACFVIGALSYIWTFGGIDWIRMILLEPKDANHWMFWGLIFIILSFGIMFVHWLTERHVTPENYYKRRMQAKEAKFGTEKDVDVKKYFEQNYQNNQKF